MYGRNEEEITELQQVVSSMSPELGEATDKLNRGVFLDSEFVAIYW